MTRDERAKVAQETIKAINNGYYMKGNEKIELPKTITNAIFYPENSLSAISAIKKYDTNIKVTNRDSFVAAREHAKEGKTVVLNFASARNAGGGFEKGANAQEESLCRASTLYASLKSKEGQKFYTAQKPCLNDLYASHILLSPSVVVFKDEQGKILNESFEVGVITAAAVNVNIALRNRHTFEQINAEMLKRIKAILNVAVVNKYENIILGAWGCGVFGNTPQKVAEMFYQCLVDDGYATLYFHNVEFAVYDTSPNLTNYKAFKRVFSK